MKKINFFVLFLCTFVSFDLLADNPFWLIRMGYYQEKVSYGINNNISSVELQYNNPRSWGLNSKYNSIHKINRHLDSGSLGGYYWLTDSTTLSAGAECSNKQDVYPVRTYYSELSQVVWKYIVPAVSYKSVEYTEIKNRIFSASLSIYFLSYWNFVFSKVWNYSIIPAKCTVLDHVYKNTLYLRFDKLSFLAGYVWGSESYDPGTLNTMRRFHSNLYTGGASWEFYKGFGIDFTGSYEKRDTGVSVKYYDFGLKKII